MHAYHRHTVQSGTGGYLVETEPRIFRTALHDAISDLSVVAYASATGDYILRSRRAAEHLVRALNDRGYAATSTRGRYTVGVRGYYDDQGWDFVAVESKEAAIKMLRA